jgi:hypothetical protein
MRALADEFAATRKVNELKSLCVIVIGGSADVVNGPHTLGLPQTKAVNCPPLAGTEIELWPLTVIPGWQSGCEASTIVTWALPPVQAIVILPLREL